MYYTQGHPHDQDGGQIMIYSHSLSYHAAPYTYTFPVCVIADGYVLLFSASIVVYILTSQGYFHLLNTHAVVTVYAKVLPVHKVLCDNNYLLAQSADVFACVRTQCQVTKYAVLAVQHELSGCVTNCIHCTVLGCLC